MSTIINLKGHTIVFGGPPLSGFGDGSALEVEWDPEFTSGSGVDGTMAVSYTGAKHGKAKLKLLQSAIANAQLSSIHAANVANLQAGGGGFFLPFLCKDNNGADIIQAARALIIGKPKYALSNTPQSREWELELFDADQFLGGNPLVPVGAP